LELTDVFTTAAYPDLNRAARKDLEAARLWRISARAQTIKFADFVSNGVDILELDPKFGAVYMEEVRNAFLGMPQGDSRLRALVERILSSPKPKGVPA
jgi:hypothetical protein